jgi:hypothetical protein
MTIVASGTPAAAASRRVLVHSGLRLESSQKPSWPPGAWLARCIHNSDVVQLTHGRNVEVTPEWFGEAVWAGPYAEGAFDQTDVVFGSGGRIRERAITFVSPASALDRLHSMQQADGVWISNSLVCLLSATGATLDPAYPNYRADLRSICNGLSRYHSTIESSAGPVVLTYCHNLEWSGRELRTVPKNSPMRDFSSFERYRGFLDASLAALAANMADPARSIAYRFLGTISSGYDSATIATLARTHGLGDVLTFKTARSGENDSGAEIARVLGLRVLQASRDAWRAGSTPEAPFLAADAKGEEVYFAGAQQALEGRVLLTGFHGDRVWDVRRPALADMARRSQSGLSLGEYRLRAGFVHLPLPFLGASQYEDIHAISVSPGMVPWRTRKSYSRPICRRIVEDAGVPRKAFGQRKRAASVLLYGPERAFSDSSVSDFLTWLEEHESAWRARGVAFPGTHLGRRTAKQRACSAAAATIQALGAGTRVAERIADKLAHFGCQEPLFRYLFPWAVERASNPYR